MFLQRFKNSRHNQFPNHQKQIQYSSKIEALLKQVDIPQIKKHTKRNSYINPRTYLIENTRKVIKPVQNNSSQQNIQPQQTQNQQTFFTHRKSISRDKVDLSSRQGRRAAAKSFRERIWKSSDVTPLVKAQQQLMIKSAKGSLLLECVENQQKIHRYQDSFLLSGHPSRRQIVRKELLQSGIRNNLCLRISTSYKNPEKLQIKNIQFNEQMVESWESNHSRQVLSRDRRKQLRMLHYSSLARPERRPSTTVGYSRERQLDDNIIQPW